MVTSLYSMGRAPSALSMVSETCARPSAERPDVPAKMTSSILPPRRDFAPCSPMTHARASTTLDLPEPLGPTTAVTPGSKLKVVAEAKDLKPRTVRVFKCTCGAPSVRCSPPRDPRQGVDGLAQPHHCTRAGLRIRDSSIVSLQRNDWEPLPARLELVDRLNRSSPPAHSSAQGDESRFDSSRRGESPVSKAPR